MSKTFCPFTLLIVGFASFIILSCSNAKNQDPTTKNTEAAPEQTTEKENSNELDTARYNTLMLALANGDTTGKWPAKAPVPLAGAILPFNRIVAYYGNLYSTRMGI